MEIPGIRHRQQLSRDGVSRRELEEWKRTGAVESIQPWYVTQEAPADLVAILRLGVRPTCIDAAALHGLWTPVHGGVHVFCPRAHRRRADLLVHRVDPLRRRDGRPVRVGPPQGLITHTPSCTSWPDVDPVPDLELVLEHAGRCLPAVKAAVLFESAINLGRMSHHRALEIVARLPVRSRRPLSRIRADAESGTETLVRWWFESQGYPVRAQVPFPGGVRKRMDLLIGASWAIECDSRSHHDDPAAFEEDRARDLYLRSWGYTVTRLSWEQVVRQWDRTESMLAAIARSGLHRKLLVVDA
jgi:very-short-patch-repair endonuclease